jgi:hypothetical protein
LEEMLLLKMVAQVVKAVAVAVEALILVALVVLVAADAY